MVFEYTCKYEENKIHIRIRFEANKKKVADTVQPKQDHVKMGRHALVRACSAGVKVLKSIFSFSQKLL
jgi:hypothetical protein